MDLTFQDSRVCLVNKKSGRKNRNRGNSEKILAFMIVWWERKAKGTPNPLKYPILKYTK